MPRPLRKNRPLPRHPSVWRSRLKWHWPFFVWLGAAALAGWLYYRQGSGEFEQFNGVVEIVMEPVASLETGRVLSIEVHEGQQVQAGDVIARLDTSLVDQEISARAVELALDQQDRKRQFTNAVQRIKSDLRELRLEQAEDENELAAAREQAARQEKMLERRLIEAGALAETKARLSVLEQRAAMYPRMIQEMEAELAELERLQKEALGLSSPGAVNSELELLRKERENYTLRAVHDGFVARVDHQAGDVVREGRPVAHLVLHKAPQVHGFVPEESPLEMRQGDTLWVTPRYRNGQVFQMRVSYISPHVLSLPDRTSILPQAVVRGRQVVLIPADGAFTLSPGQAVAIHLKKPGLFSF